MYKIARTSAAVLLIVLLSAAFGSVTSPAESTTCAAGLSKGASTPPTSAGSESLLAWDAGNSKLTWQHHHPGDLDQNGEVNGADLIKIAVHFLEQSTDPGWQEWADADQNGQVDISDETPIGVNFKTDSASYNVYESAVSDTGPWGTPIANVPFSAQQGNPRLNRLAFEHALTPPAGGAWYYVVHVDSAGVEGTKSNVIAVP